MDFTPSKTGEKCRPDGHRSHFAGKAAAKVLKSASVWMLPPPPAYWTQMNLEGLKAHPRKAAGMFTVTSCAAAQAV